MQPWLLAISAVSESPSHIMWNGEGSFLGRVSYRYNEPASPEDFDPRRSINTDQWFPCTKQITVVGWWACPVEPLASFMRALRNISSCEVGTLGLLEALHEGLDEDTVLMRELNQTDIVMWWNWGAAPDSMERARRAFPDQVGAEYDPMARQVGIRHVPLTPSFTNITTTQVWVLLNWDDPYSLFMAGNMHARKHLFDVVFSSSSATLPTYMQAGAKEAHAFVPMVDDIHFDSPDPEYDADVAFVASNPYSYPGTHMNRTALLEALAEDARVTGLRLDIYGGDPVGEAFPEFFKGPIRYEENRKVYANARISINYHVVPGHGGWYANARNTEILGSRGLLLVDDAVRGPLTERECVFWRSRDPLDMVKQVHEILQNYAQYEAMRDRGQAFVLSHFNARAHATRVLEAISRVAILRDATAQKNKVNKKRR